MRNLILALDITGQPHQWLTWETAVTMKCKELISYEFGEEDFRFFGGISRMTGEKSSMNVGSIVVLKGRHKKERTVPTLTNKNLFRRDLGICGYCGEKGPEEFLTRDHIIPVSKGGQDKWTNCVTACKKCNNKKDNKMLADSGMELLYVPYVPNRAEALVLQNRRILADQMDLLRSYIPEHSRVHLM